MKLPFYDNWQKWTVNDVLYSHRKNKSDHWNFSMRRCTEPIGTLKEELFNNASKIRDYYTGPFDVLYSGGIDSEVVLRVFKELGIKHNTIIVKYKNGYNHREITNAIETVKSLNIPYTLIDFDLEKFYETEAYDLSIESSCIRVGRATHIKFCKDFCDNIPVMGEGDVYWRRDLGTDYSKPSAWRFIIAEDSHNCGMFMTKLGRENVCDFFEFTPNIIKAYNNYPLVQQLLNDKISGKTSNWSSKWLIYRDIWPDLVQRVKLTGLEGDKEPGYMPMFVKELQDVIEAKIGPGNTYWCTPDELNKFV